MIIDIREELKGNIARIEKNFLVVALSGGADSSVAAYLLYEGLSSHSGEGAEKRMAGASHYIWPDSRCCNTEVLDRAREVCRLLNLPYYIMDLTSLFKEKVVDDFTQTYINGKTPNPCIRCNQWVRFKAFYNLLTERMRENGLLGDEEPLYFSTGHYVRVENTADGAFIKRARDNNKDQSYMLYRISKEMLEYLIFPLGEYRKDEVMEIARKLDLPSASGAESQDACFVEGEYVDFLKNYTGRRDLSTEGDIIDTEGNVIGKHKGYIHYTIGQRRGLDLGNGPWYVTDIDPEGNRVVVGRKKDARSNRFIVEETNWFIEEHGKEFNCNVRVRYNSPEIPCTVFPIDDSSVIVRLKESTIVSPGQSAVFYHNGLVMGGGIISRLDHDKS